MLRKTSVVLAGVLALPAPGCASRSDAGAALVMTGAVVAIAAAQASTGRYQCTADGCAASTSKNGAAAAAGVAAGVGLAAMGAAMAEPDPYETLPRRRTTAPPNSFRLVRPAEDSSDPPQ